MLGSRECQRDRLGYMIKHYPCSRYLHSRIVTFRVIYIRALNLRSIVSVAAAQGLDLLESRPKLTQRGAGTMSFPFWVASHGSLTSV